MTPELLLEHFDRISDAPEAVPRLRQFILELAVRGKLVPQNPEDEPASELLKRIAAIKERLKESSRTGQPPVAEGSFPIPNNWLWISATYPTLPMSDRGHKIKTKEVLKSGKIPVVDQGKEFVRGYSNEVDKAIRAKNPIIVFGDHTREVKLIDFDFIVGADGVKLLQPLELAARYYYFALKWLPVESRGYGRHFKLLRSSCIPLPPVVEQHRIVARVDELMALCDQLEAAKKERESRRDRLVAASLQRLGQPEKAGGGEDVETFREHARFHLRHLHRLATRPEHVQQLRQTILDLAVRGRLVPQDPDDEPASELLGRQRLCGDLESEPWRLPEGWAWSSYGRICKVIGGGTPSKARADFWEGSVPWVRPKDMKVDVIEDSSKHISEIAVESSSVRWIPAGALLFVVRGMILAHSLPTATTTVPVTINQDMKAAVPFRNDLLEMLLVISKGIKEIVLDLVSRSTHGTCKLPTRELFDLPIPLPPLAEQKRIVAKVDELMTVCDQLEKQLTAAHTGNQRLLEAILHESLAA